MARAPGQHEARTKELDNRLKELDTSIVEIEALLATPLGVCQPWELTDARIKMRWAVHWRDDALTNFEADRMEAGHRGSHG